MILWCNELKIIPFSGIPVLHYTHRHSTQALVQIDFMLMQYEIISRILFILWNLFCVLVNFFRFGPLIGFNICIYCN